MLGGPGGAASIGFLTVAVLTGGVLTTWVYCVRGLGWGMRRVRGQNPYRGYW